ncbi:MAG: hypothetical protein V1702_04700 [Candidatus Woesearchaeota archaeon]
MACNKTFSFALIAVFIVGIALMSVFTSATPAGVTIIPIRNETSTPRAASFVNTTGGTIATVNLNGSTQNVRWKAFVGNVSGALTLDDAYGSTVYDWTASAPSGEIYAARSSATLNWSVIGCANSTHLSMEDFAMNHTNKDDNISRTFSTKVHNQFYVGLVQIAQNACYSIHTYVNDSSQSSRFEEMVLYDGTNLTNGNVVFSTILELDKYGYNNQTYDFQMILPERGIDGWSSSTAYYFYMELS